MIKELFDHLSPTAKWLLDGAAMMTAFLTFLNQLLPAIASLLSIVWIGARIYDYFKYGRKNLKED